MNFNLFSKNTILSPHDKKQRLMLVILLVAILVILIILYFGFWRSLPEPPIDEQPSVVENGDIRGEALEALIEKIDFDASFLKSSYFKDLKVYGEWPLEIGEKGRDNPFLPY